MIEKVIFLSSIFTFFFILYLLYKDKKLFEFQKILMKYKKIPTENKLSLLLFILGSIISLITKIYVLIPGLLIFCLILPGLILRKNIEKVKELKMQQWLYFIDNMSSATKAGFSIKESLLQALNAVENPLRQDLYASILEMNRTNQISKVIPILKQDVKDEIGKNIIKVIELVHFLGATDFSKILQILSNSSREFHDLLLELKTKQSWVLNGAKIAISAPWIVLLALWTQENVRNSYQTLNGQVVLFLVALLGIAGYLVMQKIGNLEVNRQI